jgi:predicted transcriptional regulator
MILRKRIKTLHLQVPVNFWLRHFPVVKTLPSGIRYRARRVESLALSTEMFDENAPYAITDTPSNIRTFADPGYKVGYFNWSKRFGDTPCDLLKMDIEGSETKFFQNEMISPAMPGL